MTVIKIMQIMAPIKSKEVINLVEEAKE